MSEITKPERLLNLLMLLLDTPRSLTVAEIRDRAKGYEDKTDDTFHRMFERDKEEIRGIGFTIDHADLDSGVGYRIIRSQALLDDPGLTPDEKAALSMAGVAWGSGRDPSAAALGALKLGASEGGATWLLPRVATEPQYADVVAAIARRKRITFRYKQDPAERTIEPHGVFFRGGWYVTGVDVEIGEPRHFKLSRIAGDVRVGSGDEPDFDQPSGAPGEPRAPWEGPDGAEARVAFAPDAAWQVERQRPGSRRVGERPDGSVEIALPASDLASFAAWVSGFGDEAVVIEPAELRALVVERLRLAAGGA